LRILGERHPDAVEVGISERQIASDIQQVLALANEFKEARIFLGIKRFGTGYSSLSYLKEIPASTLWIDESIIRNVATDPRDSKVIDAIFQLAKNLGGHVIAEGVSNAEQSAALLDLGIKTITGSMAGDLMTGEEVYKRIST
jgi:EAL domain-containing protein (putative c-di-GMP-specific phosphodiesterase class I)